ncbi:hypothetical protein [Seinonella peptonophila]|nr:hypothetical protein [Seinonella peptonophila]
MTKPEPRFRGVYLAVKVLSGTATVEEHAEFDAEYNRVFGDDSTDDQ